MNNLTVLYGNCEVGRLVEESQRIHFAYSRSWLEEGFSISPRSLPLEDKAFTPENNHFGGLFGVFADSLPDGWGTYTAIRSLARKGISYIDLGQLEKLALVGPDGLGALRYEPSDCDWDTPELKNLDSICEECMEAIEEVKDADLDDLYKRAGSTGGARPKINYISAGAEWIVKFKERNDPAWTGRAEYEYSLAAKECGIGIPETRLFPSEICEGFFASKRFDREGKKRIHMISLGGLLEIPRQLPLLDYVSFLQATGFITQSQEEVVKAFRLACFNILSKNMDSHSKNFAYLYSEKEERYVLSPAYDLTRTVGMKEHEMTCMGKGDPGREDLLALADEVRIPRNKAKDILDTVENVVTDRLSEWIRM